MSYPLIRTLVEGLEAWFEDKGQKKIGKLLISHRSTIYPCYLPVLGEFNRSWPYKTCRLQIYGLRVKRIGEN